jgi:hypothetical protein
VPHTGGKGGVEHLVRPVFERPHGSVVEVLAMSEIQIPGSAERRKAKRECTRGVAAGAEIPQPRSELDPVAVPVHTAVIPSAAPSVPYRLAGRTASRSVSFPASVGRSGYPRNVEITSGSSPASAIHAARIPSDAALRSTDARFSSCPASTE